MTQKGTRCNICTGCGRCFDGGNGMRIVTEGGLLARWQEQLLAGSNLSETGAENRREESGQPKRPKAGVEKPKQAAARRVCPDDWLIAVDIGTTTIAMVLYDPFGRKKDQLATVNPQTYAGADVLSRIQRAQDAAEARKLKDCVWKVLRQGAERFIRTAGHSCKMVVAANTTMVYLLLGHDTGELGHAPFFASFLEKEELFFPVFAGSRRLPMTVLPGLSAFVGADICAGIYAAQMAEKEEITLFIDLGTNGEMAIGNKERIIACSTAAGPAFEGGPTKGVFGADMIHLCAELCRNKLLDETGLLADPYFEDGILIGNVLVTKEAIRNLQMAKAAILVGIKTLIEQFGLSKAEEVDKVILAGGFGYFLNPADAARIGLLPSALCDKTISGGNTVLAGILRYGFDEKGGERLEQIKEKTEILNLAQTEAFNEKYVEAMTFGKIS